MVLPMPRFSCRLVIFDLDGTLLDTAADIAVAVNRALADAGLPAVEEAQVRAWIGNGARTLIERALLHVGVDDGAGINRVLANFLRHYEVDLSSRTRPMPGAADALSTLAAEGLLLAVCTNKPVALAKVLLTRFDLDHRLVLVIGGDSLPTRKPDPAPLLHIADRLHLRPQQVLVVGDSRHDVQAAQAAGMAVVGVRHGYDQGEDIGLSRPDAVIDSLDGLPALVLRADHA